MANDGGVWVKAPKGSSTTGGGIFTKVSDGGGKWVEIGASSGEPGAAEITAITGSGITHTYGDFVAFEFLTSGSLTCTEGFVPEVLVIGGGGVSRLSPSPSSPPPPPPPMSPPLPVPSLV